LTIATEWIARYKKIRPLLRGADVYHLTAQSNPEATRTVEAALYVDSETGRALLFAFQGGAADLDATLLLRSLHGGQRYRVLPPKLFGERRSYLGGDLMDKGLRLRFPHRGASAVISLEPESLPRLELECVQVGVAEREVQADSLFRE